MEKWISSQSSRYHRVNTIFLGLSGFCFLQGGMPRVACILYMLAGVCIGAGTVIYHRIEKPAHQSRK